MSFTDLSIAVIIHTANAFQPKTITCLAVSYYTQEAIIEVNGVLPIIRK
jgi:hypothetical protein